MIASWQNGTKVHTEKCEWCDGQGSKCDDMTGIVRQRGEGNRIWEPVLWHVNDSMGKGTLCGTKNIYNL